ncbi:hypothetical protein Vadar_034160 [Vaccinium darrowii]|uniref:Uncharacterized protein n=1 Tax=Vaccinium darrowii TaxID=229202 RepID=A0ACB7XV71_9ERIC|nr:hypothetical protein Vadar_034160 [Vaccinium darrowii]
MQWACISCYPLGYRRILAKGISKANTFLSSKTAVVTPEWMAPEILCDELSNEKSDVYSFGILLWELVTLQQPRRTLDPTSKTGDGNCCIKGQRLEIPSNVNPQVGALIEGCWAKGLVELRKEFQELIEACHRSHEYVPLLFVDRYFCIRSNNVHRNTMVLEHFQCRHQLVAHLQSSYI